MKPIDPIKVQEIINNYKGKPIYLHLETTNGAYAAHRNDAPMAVSAFIRNNQIEFTHGKITGDHPYRVGLKLNEGWVFAQGLTDWEIDVEGRLLLAGHDSEGRIAVALHLSEKPFI